MEEEMVKRRSQTAAQAEVDQNVDEDDLTPKRIQPKRMVNAWKRQLRSKGQPGEPITPAIYTMPNILT